MSERIEQQVRATFDAFAAAWNAHDVAAMASCWMPAGSAVDPWGRFASGRDGVAALLEREHAESMGESSYRIDEVRVRPLSETSAVAECDAVIDGARAPNGKPFALAHHLDAVLVDDGGQWRFMSLHPSFGRARG